MKHFILFAGIAIIGLLSSCNHGSKDVTMRNGIKVPDHVIVVIEENHGYDQIMGSDSAPYINQLAG